MIVNKICAWVAAFLSAISTSSLWAASVHIDTTFTLVEEGYAVTCIHDPSGSFSAVIDDAPKPHDEWIVGDPTYTWTISPSKSLTFTPTDASTVNLTLGAEAFGKSYGITVEVKWIETNNEAGESHTITAYDSIQLVAFIIKTETIATTPTDRSRKKVGIGEEVVCSVIPATSINWSVIGGGSVSSRTGNNTTFTASMGTSTSTVYAQIGDASCTVIFTVVVPSGMTTKFVNDADIGSPGTNNIGAESVFECYVLPLDVSFYNVDFRENIPGETYTWPNGTTGTRAPQIVRWYVSYNNKNIDTVSSDLAPIVKISNGTNYVDFSVVVRVPEEYKNQSGGFVEWLPEKHPRDYRGSDCKARVRHILSTTAEGGWMGPWQ